MSRDAAAMMTGHALNLAPRRCGAALAVACLAVVGSSFGASAASSVAARPPAAPDAAPRDTAARARMLECGHQWNNMKRAGTASGTWKDFSRDCLAQR